MAGSILGNRVLRKEDPKFLTSGGRYVEDLMDEPLLANAAYVTYVRSSVAHGRILEIDTSAAASLPGVLGIFTATDLGLTEEPAAFNPGATRGRLAMGKVRFVGEPVAAVVTETRQQGADAAEQVVVDYEVLEALVDPEAAMTSSTLIYEGVGSNVVFDTTALGMPDNTGDEYFADCAVVVTGKFINQRVAPCPLEPRGSAVAWVPSDGAEPRLYQWLSTQGAQGARDSILAGNGLPAEQLRVITPDVGGGFGAKITCYPEEILLG
ncbi:MAG TPA: molybdopterin cofactor-binding domain-containing protein, partial [Ilumatobacteraceae bacterium]